MLGLEPVGLLKLLGGRFPPSRVSVPPSRFERWMIRRKRPNRLVKLLGGAILATAVTGSQQSQHYRSYQCNEQGVEPFQITVRV